MFTGVGLIAFFCIFGAGLLGLVLRGLLPEDHRSEETYKAVNHIMSVVALLAALVLGLLVASTKSSFDTRSQEIEQFSANLTLLDRELAHFEQGAAKIRGLLRAFTARQISQTWTDRAADSAKEAADTVQLLDEIDVEIRSFAPASDAQIESRKNALHIVKELKRTSRLLSVQQISTTPRPFLIVVVFWLSVLALSHTTFAPLNGTVIAAALVGALSVSVAINLIFDMDRPFTGFIKVSPAPMQQALDQMKP